jgi:hypothetical protein
MELWSIVCCWHEIRIRECIELYETYRWESTLEMESLTTAVVENIGLYCDRMSGTQIMVLMAHSTILTFCIRFALS